ncbi:MAG TPA: bifunctional adenosylcobinamide kinase/adenosylcobinamide-phosphate guanylyltransferase [Feifaniaceae bacterium]|nr:bifunctional adenosylcobinamide kinase/adenosylcobinamide-phosphate guanylyltransferase [Feifaniaceae bacterium]
MLTLIMGENGSGKSAYAESLVCRAGGTRYYIATMISHGAAGAARVEKHLRQREGMGFTTLELPYAVGGAAIPPGAAVLLEDVSNLLGNRIFGRGGTETEVLADITELQKRCRVLVAVTIGGLDASAYDGETRGYIEALNALNAALFGLADTVVELRDGVPQLKKGEDDALF